VFFMLTACGRPQGGGGPAHVDRGEGVPIFLDVINGWHLVCKVYHLLSV